MLNIFYSIHPRPFAIAQWRGILLSLLKTAVEEMPIPQDASGYCAIEALCYLFGPESLPKDPFQLRDPKRFSETLRGEASWAIQQKSLTCAVPADPTELFAMVREESFYGGISLEEGETNLHINLILPGIGGLLSNEPHSIEDVLSLVLTNDDFLSHPPKHILGSRWI